MIPGAPIPMAAYGSHFAVLAATVARTSGPVAEVGCGCFSTPLLEALIHPPRRWTTFETDPRWFNLVDHPFLPNHDSRIIGKRQVPDLRDYEVAFIDGEIPEFRADIALGCGARILVCHDAEPHWDHIQQYRKRLLPAFKYHAFYSRLDPWTLIVSNDVDPFDLLPRTLLFPE